MNKTTWFVSDMHFGHSNIIQYCKRPYKDVYEMNQALVDNWNQYVSKADTVYHLGDWAFSSYDHIDKLNGRILSVPGNHDNVNKLPKRIVDNMLSDIHYVKVDGFSFVLCHYPLAYWQRGYTYHLHGHMHGGTPKRINRLDIGIDSTKCYRPLNVKEVLQHLVRNNEAVSYIGE